ncbi:Brp/Blh family beta-carotene 15,15'-dioxygenase [Rubrivirga sp. IMCC43871]|uniref:Brp/Blh family beta-carotene 15,15'-dioxygenase n=1 Tax=Rubrivirga sp. IMCC43871 TaxID=3391575 RepID=UPI0039901767
MTAPFAWPRGGLALAWGGVAVSVALAPLLAGAPVWVLALPWAASAVVLGLPHGAADPVVPFAMRGEALRFGRVAAFCLAYLAAACVALAVWAALPTAAAVGFLLLTWAHWGQGDVYALRALGWDVHLRSPAQRLLAGAVRGALPMAVPLAAYPATYAEVVGAMAAAFRPERAEAARQLVLDLPSGAVWAGLAVLGAVYGGWGLARARRQPGAGRALALDLGEVAGLTAFFALVPPLWSVGVYFCLWHALRHLARLAPLVAGGSARRLAGLAAPATIGALGLIGALAARVLSRPDPVAGVGVYLVGIAALTVPHVLVVVWMDLRQRVWTAP